MKRERIFIMLLLTLTGVRAAIINVPTDVTTIKKAVNISADGDTILLAPGIYAQPGLIKIDKPIVVASRYIFTKNEADINSTIISAASNSMEEWFELSVEGVTVTGIKFLGNEEHTLNITSPFATVSHCKFIGGKDQLSISGGGGYVGYCYFENAGDDGIDCDNSKDWIIEHNTIVNSYQDGIEIRLQDKSAPLTRHVFRYNRVIGAGQSGIQIIDYQGNSYREFYVHNNIFQDCRGVGFSCMYQEMDNTNEVYKGSLMQETAYVYNNTFDGCNYGMTLSPGLLVLNNIFVNGRTAGIERGHYLTDENDLSIIDYCLFFNNPWHFEPDVFLGSNNQIDVDPRLDPYLNLQSESPCIGAGIDEYAWKNKHLAIPKNSYLGDAPDLGAREFGSADTKSMLPALSVGEDRVLISPENSLLLSGTISGVKSLDQVSYCWSQFSGPGNVEFSQPDERETRARFPEQGIYELALIASNSDFSIRDKVLVYFVNDFADRTVTAGDKDVYLEAESYKIITGGFEKQSNPVTGERFIKFAARRSDAEFAQYQVSTTNNGPYYIWIRLNGTADKQCDLAVSFHHPKEKKQLCATLPEARSDNFEWKMAKFENVPEGIYPLTIYGLQKGAAWDKIFITCDEMSRP